MKKYVDSSGFNGATLMIATATDPARRMDDTIIANKPTVSGHPDKVGTRIWMIPVRLLLRTIRTLETIDCL